MFAITVCLEIHLLNLVTFTIVLRSCIGHCIINTIHLENPYFSTTDRTQQEHSALHHGEQRDQRPS